MLTAPTVNAGNGPYLDLDLVGRDVAAKTARLRELRLQMEANATAGPLKKRRKT
jgi:hypothetical protein